MSQAKKPSPTPTLQELIESAVGIAMSKVFTYDKPFPMKILKVIK